MAPAQPKNQCAHETCRCDAPPGQLYCSPYCAEEAAANPEKEYARRAAAAIRNARMRTRGLPDALKNDCERRFDQA